MKSNDAPIYSTLAQEDPYFSDLVEQCIAELPAYVATLEEYIVTGNPEGAARQSHSISGSGGCHGFAPVAEIAARIEEHARAGCLDRARDDLAALKELLPRLRCTP